VEEERVHHLLMVAEVLAHLLVLEVQEQEQQEQYLSIYATGMQALAFVLRQEFLLPLLLQLQQFLRMLHLILLHRRNSLLHLLLLLHCYFLLQKHFLPKRSLLLRQDLSLLLHLLQLLWLLL